jgi:GntR family transcriptional regulator
VDTSDPRPAYVQVADDIRASIEAGRRHPGDRLPAGRELADQYGVAVMTVQKAIDVLRRESLVVSHQGRGVFITAAPSAPADELAQLRAAVEDLTHRVTTLEAKLVGDKKRTRSARQ